MRPLDLINRWHGLYQAVEVHIATLLDGVRIEARAQSDFRLGLICKSSIAKMRLEQQQLKSRLSLSAFREIHWVFAEQVERNRRG